MAPFQESWSWLAGQFGGLDKVDRDLHYAANLASPIRTYGDPRSANVDPIDWVERIPFSETRNYVQRVVEGMLVYRNRLGGLNANARSQGAAFSHVDPAP